MEKRRIGVLILFVAALITLFSASFVEAVEYKYITVDYTVTYTNGTTSRNLDNYNTVTDVKAGDKVKFTAKCTDSLAVQWSTDISLVKVQLMLKLKNIQ